MNVNPVMHGVPQTGFAAAAPKSTNSTTTPDQAATNAQQTFLSLLVTELKSQDPTSPMDPTQMVAQMLSMNQLNELIAINQTLQGALGTPAQQGVSGTPANGSGPAHAPSSFISNLIGAH